jgi:hypothetical protein
MANDRAQRIADLLHEAGEVHHEYFADVDGVDDDWATFYSEWLVSRTELPRILGRPPVRSHLTRDLVVLEKEYDAARPAEPWTSWYAKRLIETYG